MVDFALSDAERMVLQLAHDFAVREIRPRAANHDRAQTYPWDVVRKGAALGLHGGPLAGPGVEPGLVPMLIAEELAWGCAGFALAMLDNNLPATAINLIGTPEQRQRFLPLCTAAADGQARPASLALTEPDAGSDAGALTSRAVRTSDGYVLNGMKRFITNGALGPITVVFAREGDAPGFRGVSAFVVPTDAPGLTESHVWDKMGIRASHTADLAFDDVHITHDHRLGPPDPDYRSGGRGALGALTATRPWIAAMAVGISRAAFEYAAGHARTRRQFNAPLIENQGVGFLLADMDIAIDAARLLTWRAAGRLSRNEPLTVEEASKAKAFATDTAMRVTTDAVQICGGVGYMRDLPVEKWMRDAKIFQIFEGANQIQRLVISRNIAQRAF